jgi:glycosyltransferase involved in cell wall biosynthesis
MASHAPDATVIITTKNRKDDLRQAVASALMQDAHPHVLVIDDGSTDGTSDMIRTEFPTVQLERAEQSRGLIVQRNHGAALVRSQFIFSIDDDAVFTTPRIVSQTIAEFQDPCTGAVAIPFIDINYGTAIRQMAPDDRGFYVAASYIGTAHALRRDLFLKLGGYREFLFHQGEEQDYCIRMLAAGYFVRLGRADPIHHFESPKRDFRRRDLYGRRNNLLFVWCNVPLLYLPLRLLGTTINGIRAGIRVRRLPRMIHGLLMGYAAIFRYWRQRRAVPAGVYRAFRRLGQRAVQLSKVENWLA